MAAELHNHHDGPNTVAEAVYNRMPVILDQNDYNEWLNREQEKRPPMHLLRPFEVSGMRVHSAYPKVGNVRNQGTEVLDSA